MLEVPRSRLRIGHGESPCLLPHAEARSCPVSPCRSPVSVLSRRATRLSRRWPKIGSRPFERASLHLRSDLPSRRPSVRSEVSHAPPLPQGRKQKNACRGFPQRDNPLSALPPRSNWLLVPPDQASGWRSPLLQSPAIGSVLRLRAAPLLLCSACPSPAR